MFEPGSFHPEFLIYFMSDDDNFGKFQHLKVCLVIANGRPFPHSKERDI